MDRPLRPDDPGVWITDSRGEVSRVVHVSGPLRRVYTQIPNRQNGNWVWPKHYSLYKSEIRSVEMRA